MMMPVRNQTASLISMRQFNCFLMVQVVLYQTAMYTLEVQYDTFLEKYQAGLLWNDLL